MALADNCSRSASQADAKGDFFRHVAEQGHYAGRSKPTGTRQGLYVCTAGGHLLSSLNTRDPDKLLEALHQALEAWRHHAATAPDVPGDYASAREYQWPFPEAGLVLKVTARDLPRAGDDAVDERYNHDFMWLTKAEKEALIPADPQTGQTQQLPGFLVLRMARFHLADYVRGEVPRWRPEDVEQAEMTSSVERVDEEQVVMELRGEVRCVGAASNDVNPFSGQVVDMERGIAVRLLGKLRCDRRRRIFERFDLLATGVRWGATTYNGRFEDLGPAPIGFAFELASNALIERTPPQSIRLDYFG